MHTRQLRWLALAGALVFGALLGTPADLQAEDELWMPLATGEALTEGLLVYDTDNDLIVAFGGRDKHVNKSSTASDALMVLDAGIESAEWQDVTRRVSGRGPGPLYGTAGVYWPSRQEMVFFSGKGAGTAIFSLDLSRGVDGLRWKSPRVSGTARGRTSHTAVYAPELDQMLVFGGTFGNPGNARHTLNDVVVISPSGTGFQRRTLSVADGPSPRIDHSAIYDPVNRWMLVFGGAETFKSPTSAEVWALDMKEPMAPRWINLDSMIAGEGPGPRKAHSAVYDPVRQHMVVYGGRGKTAKELWALDLSSGTDNLQWLKLAEADETNSPPGLNKHGAVWVPTHDCMVVYGGSGPNGENPNAWMYHPADSTGHNWRPDPGPQCDAYDPESACDAQMTTRLFIDLRCDGFFNPGVDTLLADAQVEVEIPFSGQTVSTMTDGRGRAYFDHLDVPRGMPLSVTIASDAAGPACGYDGPMLVSGDRFGAGGFAVLSIGLAPVNRGDAP